jgi:hypothetical protein
MGRTGTAGSTLTVNEEILIQNLQAGNYQSEVPSGALNGSNTTFTLSVAPSPASSLFFFWNGQLLKAGGEDYTLTGSTIEMNIAPIASEKLIAYYLRDSA